MKNWHNLLDFEGTGLKSKPNSYSTKIIFGIKVEGPLFDTLDLENQPKVAYEYKQTITLKFYQNLCVEVNITNYISQEVLYPKIGAK